MADALSESTFLLFWTWGLWAAIRFLKQGSLGWLPLAIGCSVLAYLTRPEGMLLPAALVASLVVMPFFPATRLSWPRWTAAFGLLVVAPLCVVGPYVAAKGGLGTKPALVRVLGMAAQAPADSVERARPLDPDQGPGKTYLLALKGAAGAVAEAISIPLLPLTFLGVWAARSRAALRADALFLGFIVLGAFLAFVRLHATNGYCTVAPCPAAGTAGNSRRRGGIGVAPAPVAFPGKSLPHEGKTSASNGGPGLCGRGVFRLVRPDALASAEP